MRKTTILFLLLGLFISLNAQQIQPIKKNLGEKISKEQLLHIKQLKNSAKSTNLDWVFPGDFAYEVNAGSTGATAYSNVLFPDSTAVTVSITGGVGIKSHVWNAAIGQVFDPYSVLFDANLTSPLVSNRASYIIDSVAILAWYSKRLAVNDTLILEFTHNVDGTNNSFVDGVYIPRITDTIWFACPKMLGSPNQFGYEAKLTDPLKTIVKYTLTVNDSSMSGKFIKIPIGLTIPAGHITGLSMSFVPGYSYNFGDTIYTYGTGAVQTTRKNTFRFLYQSEDASPTTGIFYDPFGKNLSYMITLEGRYGKFTNTLFNQIMYPSIDGSVYIGWKIQGQNTNFVKGKVFFDENNNGVKEPTEQYVANQKVLLLPDSIISSSNNNGEYKFLVDSGSYTVKYLPTGIWELSTPNASYPAVVSNVDVSVPDFGVYAEDTSLIRVTLTGGTPICNMNVSYWINIISDGTNTESGIIAFMPDAQTSITQSSPPYDSISNGSYFWNFSNLLPSTVQSIHLTLQMPGFSSMGDTLTSFAYVQTNNINFSDTLREIFRCSYDPNDKAVYPFGKGTEKYTLMNESLRYTIRFQNTGNYLATNIAIRDTLNANLDKNTFKVLASSHSVNTNLKTDGSIIFRFDNIMLPDSATSQELSQGYITYSISPKAGLADNTEINNTAYIYFDLNPPIVTNTTLNTMVYTYPKGINNIKSKPLIVYPNPSNGKINIQYPKTLNPININIYNSQGQEVYKQYTVKNISEIELNAKGLYLVKVSDNENVWVSKVVIN